MTGINNDYSDTASVFPWSKCPTDISLHILGMLESYKDLLSCCLVCQRWSKLATDSSLYTVIDTFSPMLDVFDGNGWDDRLCKLIWQRSGKQLRKLCLDHGSESSWSKYCCTDFPDCFDRPSLTQIVIQKCIDIKPSLMERLLQGSPSITRLELSQCLWLDDRLAKIIGSYKGLRILKLDHAYELTDLGLACILNGNSWDSFESLHFTHCPLITFTNYDFGDNVVGDNVVCEYDDNDVGVNLVGDNVVNHQWFKYNRHHPFYPRLKVLFLGNCRAIKESFLPIWSHSFKQLESISLENLSSCVTDSAIQQMMIMTMKKIPGDTLYYSWQNLSHLNLSGCYCITDCGFACLLGLPLNFMKSMVQNDLSLAQVFGSSGQGNQYDRSMQLVMQLVSGGGSDDSTTFYEYGYGYNYYSQQNDVCSWKTLNISGCLLLTDRILSLIAVKCPFLETLVITDCSGLSESGLNRLRQDRPEISIDRW